MWIIGYPNGSTFSYPAITHLPTYITPSANGINITVQDLKLNMTNYTCSLDVLVPDPMSGLISHMPLLSRTGTLIITFPVVLFRIFSQQNNHSSTIRRGETLPFQIIKEGGGHYMYNVTVRSTGMYIITTIIITEQSVLTSIMLHG